MSSQIDQVLAAWRERAELFEHEVGKAVIGLDDVIRQITIGIFARGHLMLEGDVGVGKTTLLRAVARGLGGAYERIEGTVDLMPSDLVYHTYINEQGRPQVDPGPILKHGEMLSVFFFNEINRARPQVHALLLRIMAERSVEAFNRDHHFPYLQIFADRNRVEREETFEIPSAARDRFMMELHVRAPQSPELLKALMFDPRYHDVDRLIAHVTPGILPYREIADIAPVIQSHVTASESLETYALDLWKATRNPSSFGIRVEGVDVDHLILAGASPRGMSMLLRAARVHAWLEGRSHLVPEDIQGVFRETIAHRVFLAPVYEIRRESIMAALMDQILGQVPAP
jgi:MoxR-like ATPase